MNKGADVGAIMGGVVGGLVGVLVVQYVPALLLVAPRGQGEQKTVPSTGAIVFDKHRWQYLPSMLLLLA